MRRRVLSMTVAMLWAGAGSALLAPSALAGGIDTDNGVLSGALYNASPYTWTKVAEGSPHACIAGGVATSQCWLTPAAATIAPGASSLYELWPNLTEYPVIGNLYSTEFGYDAWVTYRVDVLGGGAPEYVTFTVTDAYGTGVYGTSQPELNVFNTTAQPPSGFDPASPPGAPPGATANPQVTYTHNVPYMYDQTFSVVGDYTVDASTDLGQPFVDLLNTLCSGQGNTTCAFTQTTPITYGPGTLGSPRAAQNCDLSGVAPGGQPSTGDGDAPPDNDPNYTTIQYSAAQSASLSVGGGITASTRFSLFGTIASKLSVSVEAEHQWEEVKTFTRSTLVYIPSNSWGFVWVAPTVGRVTGTLVATLGSSTFTATNFTQVRSGVTGVTDPIREPTPAFNVVTKTRPMTDAEKRKFCGASSASRLRALQASNRTPPARLVPGRSVSQVALGDTQEAVLRRLGWPAEKRFELNPCRGMLGCTAVRGVGGTWNYEKRKLAVVFGPDRRVAALIHSGSRRTRDGVGKGSTMAALRGKFPQIACRKLRRRVDCTVKRISGRQTTTTVFRLTDRGHGRWKTSRVLVHVDGGGQERT